MATPNRDEERSRQVAVESSVLGWRRFGLRSQTRRQSLERLANAQHIFIAYSHSDLARARLFRRKVLRLRRHRPPTTVFLDHESLIPTETVDRSTVDAAITQSDLFVVLCGAKTGESAEVQREIDVASIAPDVGTRTILPVILQAGARLPATLDYKTQGIFFSHLFPSIVGYPLAAALLIAGLVVGLTFVDRTRRRQTAQAESRSLAAQALSALESRARSLALERSIAATERSPTFEATDALRKSLRADLLRRVMVGDGSPVLALTFLPDREMLVASTEKGTLLRWSIPSGLPLDRLQLDTAVAKTGQCPTKVRQLIPIVPGVVAALSRNGAVQVVDLEREQTLLSLKATDLLACRVPQVFAKRNTVVRFRQDNTVEVRDLTTGALSTILTTEKAPMAVTIGAAGDIFSAESSSLKQWSPDGVLRQAWPYPEMGWVSAVTFDPSGESKISSQGMAVAWSNQTFLGGIGKQGPFLNLIHEGEDIDSDAEDDVDHLEFSSDGQRLLIIGDTLETTLYDLDYAPRTRIHGKVRKHALSPTGVLFVAVRPTREITLTDLRLDPPVTHQIPNGDDKPRALAISADERYLAAGYDDGQVRLWETQVGGDLPVLSHYPESIEAMVPGSDAETVLTAASDGFVYGWSQTDRAARRLFQAHENGVDRLVSSPDGATLATWSARGHKVRLWRSTSPDQGFSLTREIPCQYLGWIDISSDASLVAVSCSDTIVYNAVTGQELVNFEGRDENLTLLRLSPSQKLLLYVEHQTTPLVYKLASGHDGRARLAIEQHDDIYDAVFLGGDKTLVTGGSNGQLVVWNPQLGQRLRTLDGHQADIRRLAADEAGSRLYSADSDGRILKWDLASWQLVASIEAHEGRITALDLCADGGQILSASTDGTARLWNRSALSLNGILRSTEAIDEAFFDEDCGRVFTLSRDGNIREFVSDPRELLAVAQQRRAAIRPSLGTASSSQ